MWLPRWPLWVAILPIWVGLGGLCPNTCTATIDNSPWPCRYANTSCKIPVALNSARDGAQEINIAVLGPYSGALGDLMTMVEPALELAAQDIEMSSFLPGFRVNIHVVDSKCTKPDATTAVYAACSTGPPKHIILGDSCSAACESINDAARFFNVLQVSPGCVSTTLSDAVRYPYFTRMAPSTRFNVVAIYEFMKYLGFLRVGVLYGYRSINEMIKDTFLELVEADLQSGTYAWTILLTRQITNRADASSASELLKKRDSRINFVALYEDLGAVLLCQAFQHDLLPPDFNWMVASGWWNANYIASLAQTPDCPCASQELLRASSGLVAADRGPMLSTQERHGLSGRRLIDINQAYSQGCQLYANGKGACNHQWAGYFYDGLWLIASILHAYLVGQNRSVSDLGKDYSREALYNLSLHQDFMGLTGRVRQFNGHEPVTTPASHGDREGIILLRQVTGPAENAFTVLAHRSAEGLNFLADIRWSHQNSSQRVACAAGTCDRQAGWIPADQDSRCAPGTVWNNLLGCVNCPAGRYGPAAAEVCLPCPPGSYNNASGKANCEACPPGSSAIIEGLEHCISCPLGYFMNISGAVECTKCPRDTYGDSRGLSLCIGCPEGKSVEFEGATEASACTCRGWLWYGQCVSCPYGTRFQEGSCVQCAMDEICEGGQVVGHLPSHAEWVHTIELAGRLPQLSQSTAKQFLFVAAGVLREENQAKMHQGMHEFSAALQALIAGNSSQGIIPAPNEAVVQALSRTSALWANFSVLLQRQATEDDLQEAFDQSVLLLDATELALDGLLKAAQAAGSTEILVADLAESQLMLVQRICKETLFIAAGISVDQARKRLKMAEELYESSHEALVLGLEAAGIPRLQNVCTMHKMRDVTYYFQQLRQPTRAIMNARTNEESIQVARSFRLNMSAVVDPLSDALSSAVHLFVSKESFCDPLAGTTEEEWMHLAVGLAEQRVASQSVFRYFMQVVHGIDVASSKVELAVQLSANNNQLLSLVQGSRAQEIPAPPTQALLDELVKLHVAWDHMRQVLSDAVYQDVIPEVDITEVEIYNAEFLLDTSAVMELLSLLNQCPTVGILNVTNHQAAAFDMIFTEAALISYGHARLNWERLNHTRAAFRMAHDQLLQGASAAEAGTDLEPVHNVCIVRAMAAVESSFQLLEKEALAAAHGGKEQLRSMMTISTGGISRMNEAARAFMDYYDNKSAVVCEDADLSAAEWLQLIEHISSLAALGEDASGAFLLRDRASYQAKVHATVRAMEATLHDLKYGSASPPLPAPPSQDLFDESTYGLGECLEAFEAAVADADEAAVLAATESLLTQVSSMQSHYVQTAAGRHPNWPGTRVRVASWQTVLAKKVYRESLLSTQLSRASDLDATVAEFESAHNSLRHGGGGLTGIIKEREDLYQQWQKVDAAWKDLKQLAVLGGSSPEAMKAADLHLEDELHVLVSLCSLEDVVPPEKGPGPVVACFAVISSVLALCACCGPLLEWTRQRRAKRKQLEQARAKAVVHSGFSDNQDKSKDGITGIV